MTQLDRFESVFQASVKEPYRPRPVPFRRVAVVTDLATAAAEQLCRRARSFLAAIDGAPESEGGELGETDWRAVNGDRLRSVGDLLGLVEAEAPDLVVTYRHLHSDAWRWPYSLGAHVDVLTQATDVPVLLLPHPGRRPDLLAPPAQTEGVLAVTDRLTGDHELVHHAVAFTAAGGTCTLAHVTDGRTLERFLDVISRIPQIDTDTAREHILERLQKEPRDYIRSCREALAGRPIEIRKIVTVGHQLAEYRRLVEEQRADLVLFHTKDEEQLAMHGLAYALAVELRDVPLLLL